MRLGMSALVAIAAPCLLTIGFGSVAYGQTQRLDCEGADSECGETQRPTQTQRLNCEGVDAECLVSEVPVPHVRIVRQRDYPARPAHYLSSNLYTTLAADRETGRRFCAFDFQVTPNGGGPDAHTHRNEWETFFVEQGTVTFAVGVNPNPPFNFITKEIPAGTVVYGPQGPVHGFHNTSSRPARIFSFVMPCGLDNFFHTSGAEVVKYDAPIPPVNFEEITRTAFWAEQRGDGLHFPGAPPPVVPPGTPTDVIANINDAKRPHETGPFGETRVVLLKPTEVGNITGATAFCGPGLPGREGGTVKYSYFSMPSQRHVPAPYVSGNTEVFYTLGGSFVFTFTNPNDRYRSPKRVLVKPLSFIQIEPGVEFSIANAGQGPRTEPARSLAISVIPPAFCPPPPFPLN
jgi:mannose-6-phosphate isomerase-like protein (cupin superfamily)